MTDDIIKALSIGYTIIIMIGIARILWLIDPVLGIGYLAMVIMSIIATCILFAQRIKSRKSKGGYL